MDKYKTNYKEIIQVESSSPEDANGFLKTRTDIRVIDIQSSENEYGTIVTIIYKTLEEN